MLRAGRRKVQRVLVAEVGGKSGHPEGGERLGGIIELARQRGVPVERVPSMRLDALLKVGQHHQGTAAEASAFPYTGLADVERMCRKQGGRALVLLLDSVQDPQNFGTLLRTSEAVGVTAVVMLDRRQVEVTPAVVNASAGAVEHLNICQ